MNVNPPQPRRAFRAGLRTPTSVVAAGGRRLKSLKYCVLPSSNVRASLPPFKYAPNLNPALTVLAVSLAVALLAGCTAPIGADRVTTRQAYDQVDATALRTGKPSAATVAILHRFDLDRLAASQPDEAVRQLHQKALATGERDVLFALAELSYVTGDLIQRSVKPWDPRDARDYYLGSAVYAWLFLYGEGADAPPGNYSRGFREACDFYNYGLGLALTERRSTNAAVRLVDGPRRLPVGEINLQVKDSPLASRVKEFEEILLADQFRVRGLSVRNRAAGIGTPLICVGALNPEFGLRPSTPATVFLRGPASLAGLAGGKHVGSLELYSALDEPTVAIGGAQVPLETDLTTYRAYTLNQSTIWALGRLQFLAPGEHVRSQLILGQPYVPGRIPAIFVHGTFSSPVTWAEMANSLTADPVLRNRYQLWSFIYSSGNPLPVSVAQLRDALTAMVQKLDPEGKDPALREMLIIGHSQGGLLTKCTAIETGDRLWREVSTQPIEDLKISETEREKLRHWLYFEPLPFVRRVVFISTPHRGSYLAGGFARKWARRLMSLPQNMLARGKDLVALTQGSATEKFLRGKMPTSLDGMSPDNPGLLALADIPVVPTIKSHSIISVEGDGDYHHGRDGVVAYSSAHQDYVESEFIVRSYHTCLDQPATIEEVRRILHEHLKESRAGAVGQPPPSALQPVNPDKPASQ
jgi:pimeloyl-ACP methyl ester carboxylesterase